MRRTSGTNNKKMGKKFSVCLLNNSKRDERATFVVEIEQKTSENYIYIISVMV